MEQAQDCYFMQLALEQAKLASDMGEVPVGAVIVRDGIVVSQAHNRREIDKNATAHAELVAIHAACESLGGWRLHECTLYVTLEPCPMCAGAIVNSRIKRVVFGAKDPKAGCYGSIIDFNSLSFNHKPEVVEGVLEGQCSLALKFFFKNLRKNK